LVVSCRFQVVSKTARLGGCFFIYIYIDNFIFCIILNTTQENKYETESKITKDTKGDDYEYE